MNEFLKHIRLSDLLGGTLPPGPGPEPGPAGQDAGYEAGYGKSRWNSLKAGLRARFLFPAPMQAPIDERSHAFSAQRRTRTLLDSWLCLEMARASVKIDVANELLTINLERVLYRVENNWDQDAAAREDRRAKGLPDQPYDIARELGRSKHGTLILISRWEALGEAVAANQGLDEAQIQMAYDLLAIPKVLRNGSRQVPAANDVPAIATLVEARLAATEPISRSLNAADESDREMARLTIVKQRDSVTRGLKADLHRAEKRFAWAEEAFHRLRQGVDPATIIDPDTKAPIKPNAPAAPHRNRNRNLRPPNRRRRRQPCPTRGSNRVSAASPPQGLFGRRRGDAPDRRQHDRRPVPAVERGAAAD